MAVDLEKRAPSGRYQNGLVSAPDLSVCLGMLMNILSTDPKDIH